MTCYDLARRSVAPLDRPRARAADRIGFVRKAIDVAGIMQLKGFVAPRHVGDLRARVVDTLIRASGAAIDMAMQVVALHRRSCELARAGHASARTSPRISRD